MALRLIDGFDHYTTAGQAFQGKWTNQGNQAASITGSNTRNGSVGALRVSDPRQGFYKELDYQQTWIMGAAIYSSLFSDNSPCYLFTVWQDTIRHAELVVTSSGVLQVRRAGTALLTSGAYGVPINTYVYIEWKITISDTVGATEVRVNGVPVITGSSLDTQNGGSAVANRIYIQGIDPGFTSGSFWYDDFYLCDATGGSPQNDFLGDSRVETLMPSGNGNSSQLTGSDGNSVDNYLLVDEASPNDDTDYVESSNVGDKDTYVYADLATTSGTVYGVQLNPRYRKTDAGSRQAKSIARLSGTEEDSAAKIVYDTYLYGYDIRPTKPGGGAWTISDVNNAEFGMKVYS